jgi:hypothetical protein
LLMTGSSMANGCDVTESDVTGIDATGIRRPKVGDSPVYFDLFEVCCTPRVCAEHTSGNDVTSGHVTSCDVISGQGRFQ